MALEDDEEQIENGEDRDGSHNRPDYNDLVFSYAYARKEDCDACFRQSAGNSVEELVGPPKLGIISPVLRLLKKPGIETKFTFIEIGMSSSGRSTRCRPVPYWTPTMTRMQYGVNVIYRDY